MNMIKHTACAALVAAITLPAAALPVTYSFTGTVQSDDANRGYGSFAGSFNFDTATADGIADASTGAYAHGAGYGMSITWDGAFTLSLQGDLSVLTTNDLGGADQLGVLARMGDDTFSLSLWDFTQTLLSSDALPAQALTLAGFGWNTLSWQSVDGELLGSLTSLACAVGCSDALPPPPPPGTVPEPGSLMLAGLGLAGLLTSRAQASRVARRAQP
jgi:hypothetical protein